MSELPEVIDSTEEIEAFLERIVLARNPLLISLANELYSSSVISVESELMPNNGNLLLRPGRPAKIRVTHEGVPHIFRSVPIEFSTDSDGYPYHQISTPEQISALRKRESYRIPIKLSESPKIRVWLANEQSCEAWIENISDSGASIRLKGKHEEVALESVIECEMKLVEVEKLLCQAVVRHQHYQPRFNESRLGLEFWELPKTQAKILHRAIMKLQRHSIRTDLTL
jgi:c-di-GMP-binding flagellar brake protein YcgR